MSASDTPSIRTFPPLIESSPDRQLRSVVLPDPLGPMIASISPRFTPSVTPRRACTSTLPVSYVLTRSRASTMVSRNSGSGANADRGRVSTATAIAAPPLSRSVLSLALGGARSIGDARHSALGKLRICGLANRCAHAQQARDRERAEHEVARHAPLAERVDVKQLHEQ